MSNEPDIMDALLTTIHAESNNNPPPTLAVVEKIYSDNIHIDAKLLNGEIIEYIKAIGTPSKNDDAIIVFIDGDLGNPVAITK